MSEPAQPGAVPTCYRHPDREAYIKCQRCGRVICPDCMRDSAVGFQCPECVKEGSRATRSGRTAYGGLRPSNAGITSMVIIALNVAVWVVAVSHRRVRSRLLDWFVLRPQGLCLEPQGFFDSDGLSMPSGAAPCCPGVADGAYWQLLTSTFSHVAIWHIWASTCSRCGCSARSWSWPSAGRGSSPSTCSPALAGSTLVYWIEPEYTRFGTLGASGAVFGLMGALLVIAYKVKADVQQILIWIGINAVLTFTIPNISWQGHLGGFLGGMLIAAILVYAPRQRRTQVQVVGLVLFARPARRRHRRSHGEPHR